MEECHSRPKIARKLDKSILQGIQTMEEKWKNLVQLDQKTESDLATIETVKEYLAFKPKLSGKCHEE